MASVAALVAGLVACASGPEPEPVALALARAVESGDFTAVPLADTSADQAAIETDEATRGMGGTSRTVVVEDITTDDAVATVTLGVTWDLGSPEADWTYPATARLIRGDDGWDAEWATTVLYPDLEPGDRLTLRRSQAERGDVVGAGGAPLVTARPVYRIGIDKTKVEPTEHAESAAALAELVDVDPGQFTERVAAAGDKAFVEAITLRDADAQNLLAGIGQIPGASALPGSLPLAPTREFARPILGSVGQATEEIIEESGGTISAGDVVGLSGLQRWYDDDLRGTPGISIELVAADGDREVVHGVDAVPGEPVTTTLDIDLQLHAEAVLADVGPASAIVAVEPSTGAVRAAASGSGGDGYSTATLGQYAPGSTFKIVTALALLRAGLSPESVLDCSPTIEVDGRSFKNYSDYPSHGVGDVTLRTAFAHSCNTALIGQRDLVSQADLADAALALGLGVDPNAGVPAFLGTVPSEAPATEHAASLIGQGKVLASPLGMATVAASVAAGHTVRPYLVDGFGSGEDAPPSTVTSDEAQVLADLMRAVVTEGSGQFLRDVPGDPVEAKTGTAEYGTDSPPRTHAWMVGVQGDLAVAVFVEDGETGSQTAGPLLAEFLRGR